ncbi:hypothetical protein QBC35DRAFT_490052 [Podospora australis]|uniref:Uncharacterized protein n=1 Tax=Podospora australis TaxID=1536484 RepID=A0AAN6X0F8_9PEZI|nr:hypothetical protein QBC35DRAFT_490052 [Podospora australis]
MLLYLRFSIYLLSPVSGSRVIQPDSGHFSFLVVVAENLPEIRRRQRAISVRCRLIKYFLLFFYQDGLDHGSVLLPGSAVVQTMGITHWLHLKKSYALIIVLRLVDSVELVIEEISNRKATVPVHASMISLTQLECSWSDHYHRPSSLHIRFINCFRSGDTLRNTLCESDILESMRVCDIYIPRYE